MIDRQRTTPERVATLAQRSVEIILANQAPTGAYLASPNFPAYRYSWLRDGAFIADAMSRVGEIESAEAFFGWCAGVVTNRRAQIERLIERHAAGEAIDETEFPHTRYTVDGADSPEDWAEFQLDGYGKWLWALDAHRRRHDRPLPDLLPGAELSAHYVAAFHDHPTYDWWEEFVDHHVSTLGSLYGGIATASTWPELSSATRAGLADATANIRTRLLAEAGRVGHFPKVIGGTTVDASLLTLSTPFRVVEPGDPRMRATLAEIERTLVVDAGVHRHAADIYFGGGQWLLLAAILGWHYVELGRLEDAWVELDWIAGHANPAGELPEQVADHLLAPDHFDDWPIPVASPLLWSHAMYLTLATELGALA